MRQLIPLFVVVWALNFACAVFIIIFGVKFRKLKIKEFYHKFIVWFLIIACLSRILELMVLTIGKPDRKFNRADAYNPIHESYLIYTPVVFHGLTGLAYVFRWSSYCVFTTAIDDLEEAKVNKKLTWLKWTFLIISGWYIILLIIDGIVIRKRSMYELKVFNISIYIGSSIALLIVSNYFLRSLRKLRYQMYLEKHTIVRRYTLVISIWLIIRGANDLLDLLTQKFYGNHVSVKLANDISMMTWYFTEITPSFVITYILWKSYKERKGKAFIKYLLLITSTSPNSNKDSIYFLRILLIL